MSEELKCKKHNIDLECMGGRSAHPSNWYCPQCEKGQRAWEKFQSLLTNTEDKVMSEELKPYQPIIIYPIPISNGGVVTVHNLPSDLTITDAEKIGRAIKALAGKDK